MTLCRRGRSTRGSVLTCRLVAILLIVLSCGRVSQKRQIFCTLAPPVSSRFAGALLDGQGKVRVPGYRIYSPALVAMVESSRLGRRPWATSLTDNCHPISIV